MPVPTRVYFDVENTLRVPFISGIQRVVRELSRRLIENKDSGFEFIPVVYCAQCKGWRKLSVDETEHLKKLSLSDAKVDRNVPAYRKLATNLLGKRVKSKLRNIVSKLSHPAWHKDYLLPTFEQGSIFLDIDASWHNKLKRSSLLPALKEDGVYIVAFHYDIIPILFPDLTHDKTHTIFIEHLHAQVQGCDLFICISRNSENDLLGYCREQFPEKIMNTTTIKLGTDIPCKAIDNNSWPLPEKEIKYILCVGTIEPRKNYNLLLDAFDLISKNHPGLSLVIVGREGWNSAQTISRIQQHELLNERLYWLSGISDEALSALYMNASLTVVPSLYEGFGLPVTEALQRGCITLSSDRGALKEAGGDFVYYFNPENLHSFLKLLESQLRDEKWMAQKLLLRKYHATAWSYTVSELTGILHANTSAQVCNQDI